MSDFDGVFATIPLATSNDPFSEFRFFGVISSRPFNTVEIRKSVAGDFVTVDAVYFGRSVPEAPLLALTSFAFAAAARRRCFRSTRHPR